MFIKCEKCSRVYEVSDEKVKTLSPHFFKCTACGFVFDAPFVTEKEMPVTEENEILQETEDNKNAMPLADIFSPLPETEDFQENSNIDNTEDVKVEALSDALNKDSVFEPIKSKVFYFPRWLVGLLAFVLTFGCVSYLFYVGRFYFVRKIPFTESVYDKAGISTDIIGEGLVFEDTLFELKSDLGQSLLSIRSNLVNTTGKTKNIPQIIVLIKDDSGVELQREYVFMDRKEIETGEKVPFDVILNDVHQNASKIEITFMGALD